KRLSADNRFLHRAGRDCHVTTASCIVHGVIVT
ncbi:hypothetical protein SJDPG2_08150, partial [Porphyromonas gingivalis SJD2]